MPQPNEYSFSRYLDAKKSVEDRALNQQVWECLARSLDPRAALDQPVRVLEVGCGIGTMLERMTARGLLANARWTGIDADPATVEEARQRLSPLSSKLRLELHAVDLLDFAPRQVRRWDLVVASAFLDLVDVPSTLPLLLDLVEPAGLFYSPVVFDGLTILEPEIDRDFDARVERLYHRTMDERRRHGRPSGDSRSGRHLFQHLKAADAELVAAGSSDWVVFARSDGYPMDEEYFLHFLIHTQYRALLGHPQLDRHRFESWIAARHAQIEANELVLVVHQLDFLARAGGGAMIR